MTFGLIWAHHPQDQESLLVELSTLIGSQEVPIHVRNQIAGNLYLMIKAKGVVKFLLVEAVDCQNTLKHVFSILTESCLQTFTSASTALSELQMHCAHILISLMSLNNRKYHIPGETSEKAKLRQKALDQGILAVLLNVHLNSQNEQLRQFLAEEFLERLEE